MGQSTFEKRRVEKALMKLNKTEREMGREPSTVAVQGAQKFSWSDTATVVACVFAVAFVVALAMGYILTPGGIVAVLGYNAVKPRRTIALSSQSVSIWKQSAWSGSVNEVLGTYPRNALTLDEWTTVDRHLPVKLKGHEVASLQAAQQRFGPVADAASAGLMPPPPSMANSLG